MTVLPTHEQNEIKRRARNEAEDAKAKELDADVAWLRRAAGELDTVFRVSKRFDGMIER